MNPIRFWFAIFALFGLAIIAPGLMYFTGTATNGLPTDIRFLVGLMPVLLVLFTLTSWVGG